jgi:hypothetical protein
MKIPKYLAEIVTRVWIRQIGCLTRMLMTSEPLIGQDIFDGGNEHVEEMGIGWGI